MSERRSAAGCTTITAAASLAGPAFRYVPGSADGEDHTAAKLRASSESAQLCTLAGHAPDYLRSVRLPLQVDFQPYMGERHQLRAHHLRAQQRLAGLRSLEHQPAEGRA